MDVLIVAHSTKIPLCFVIHCLISSSWHVVKCSQDKSEFARGVDKEILPRILGFPFVNTQLHKHHPIFPHRSRLFQSCDRSCATKITNPDSISIDRSLLVRHQPCLPSICLLNIVPWPRLGSSTSDTLRQLIINPLCTPAFCQEETQPGPPHMKRIISDYLV